MPEPTMPDHEIRTPAEVNEAVAAAIAAATAYAALPFDQRANFLDRIAERIEQLGEPLLAVAHRETHLPLPRLTGERARTCTQFRNFARMIREPRWMQPRIDPGDPSRAVGGPKPDLRKTQIPLGPVAVFGASNFPFAYSVAGGDTASALAAGCPVVAKVHPAHPETSELMASAIRDAVADCGLPAGVFGLVSGGAETGEALVQHPGIAAVGFTGSQRVGRHLYNLCAARPIPIPVYAEMGSINPVFLLPGALAERGDAIAKGYAESLSQGIGQFCTNPGIVVGIAGEALAQFLHAVDGYLVGTPQPEMLTPGIQSAYESGVRARSQDPTLESVTIAGGTGPALFAANADAFTTNAHLHEELFGPSGITVRCRDIAEMERVAHAMEGQLTSSLHFARSDYEAAVQLLPALATISGRVIANGFPTGVEVSPAMMHGGPYPSSTDSRSTSVGLDAIWRFLRPVTFQNLPPDLLPPELRS